MGREKIKFHEKNLKYRKIILLINFIFALTFFLFASYQIFKNYAILINYKSLFQEKDTLQLNYFHNYKSSITALVFRPFIKAIKAFDCAGVRAQVFRLLKNFIFDPTIFLIASYQI